MLQRHAMFSAIEPDGVRMPDGTLEIADVILWATGFRPAVDHLAPLRLTRALTPLLPRIREHRCLTYTLRPRDQKNYELGQLLNGMSHARMGQVLEETFGVSVAEPPQYHGGEFFAATHGFCRDLLPRIEQLWPRAVAEARWPDSIKEEAHFLSILAYAQGVPPYTANDVIRRIWTNFEDINTCLLYTSPSPRDS